MTLIEFMKLYKPELRLENYQRETLERLNELNFAELENRILAHTTPRFNELVLGVDFGSHGDLTSVCIARKIWSEGGEVKMMIIDDIFTEPPPRRMEIGRIDQFRFIESPIREAVEEPEPTAKNGARASRKTERAKAKLAFYQGKRRF